MAMAAVDVRMRSTLLERFRRLDPGLVQVKVILAVALLGFIAVLAVAVPAVLLLRYDGHPMSQEEGVNMTANSLHPGAIITNLLRHHSIIDVLHRTLGKLVLKNAKQGAATQCYVALHPDAKGVSGKYWCDSNLYEPSEKAKDAELGKKLWDYTLDLVA